VLNLISVFEGIHINVITVGNFAAQDFSGSDSEICRRRLALLVATELPPTTFWLDLSRFWLAAADCFDFGSMLCPPPLVEASDCGTAADAHRSRTDFCGEYCRQPI